MDRVASNDVFVVILEEEHEQSLFQIMLPNWTQESAQLGELIIHSLSDFLTPFRDNANRKILEAKTTEDSTQPNPQMIQP